jgi:hypothetical protein
MRYTEETEGLISPLWEYLQTRETIHSKSPPKTLKSNSISQNSNLQRGISPSSLKKVRYLFPNYASEVFNEWGAVLQRQDEVDQQMKLDDAHRLRHRQQLYRIELDNQLNSHQLSKGLKWEQNAMVENNMLDY